MLESGNIEKTFKKQCFFNVFSIFPLSSTNPSSGQFLPSSHLILEPLGLNLEPLDVPLPPFGPSWGHLGSSLGCLGALLGALVPLIVSILVPLGANCGNLDPQDLYPLAFLAKFHRFFDYFWVLFPSNPEGIEPPTGGSAECAERLNKNVIKH